MRRGSLSAEEKAGRLLWIGLPGPDLEAEGRALLREVRPAGIILFARNIASPGGVHRLIQEAVEICGELLVAIDQEGGRVDRLRSIAGSFPSARAVAATRRSALARRHGAVVARLLRILGIGVDFAPVVDLDRGFEGNGIGDRSWGRDPKTVVRMASAFLTGLRGGGVAGCLKHFPGLGASQVDSHYLLPRVNLPADELEEDLSPYRELSGLAASVMVAHCLYPGFSEPAIPASLSRRIISGILRRRLGYRGPVISDDLEMKAVDREDRIERSAPAALGAGCDLLLVCRDPARIVRARDGVATAIRERRLPGSRIEDALGRSRSFLAAHATRPGGRFDEARWSRGVRAYGKVAVAVTPGDQA